MSPATAKLAGTARLARMKHNVTADKHSQGADGGPAGGGRSAPVAAKAAAINAEQERPLTWKTVIKRALVVAVAGAAIYLVLPILALPAILAGTPVSLGLAHTALLGIAGFVLFAIFGVILLYTDRPLAAVGRAAQGLRNRITRGHRPPLTNLDKRLLTERDTIRTVLGEKWWQAVLLTAGRLGFDYGCLLAALRATGTSPRPSLVLLAYSAAGIVALFPLTPGGLGVVEASLSGLLILAGVRAGDAFLATLAYRVASYWLPLLAGPPAYLLFRHRYGTPATRPADQQGTDADPGHRPRCF
jgi:uncharacterized membrane protein YbhN (UPF0104 family)